MIGTTLTLFFSSKDFLMRGRCISILCYFSSYFFVISVFTIISFNSLMPWIKMGRTLFVNGQIAKGSLELIQVGKGASSKILVMRWPKQKDSEVLRRMFMKILVSPCSDRTTEAIPSMRANDGLDFVGYNFELLFSVFKELLNLLLKNVFCDKSEQYFAPGTTNLHVGPA